MLGPANTSLSRQTTQFSTERSPSFKMTGDFREADADMDKYIDVKCPSWQVRVCKYCGKGSHSQ